jgi:hypothetical protein
VHAHVFKSDSSTLISTYDIKIPNEATIDHDAGVVSGMICVVMACHASFVIIEYDTVTKAVMLALH